MKVRTFNSLLILPIPPIFFALAFWWSSIYLVPEEFVKYLVLAGLVIGISIDVLLFRRYLKQVLSPYVLILSYIFYMICVFGFFMGVPVFNIFVCIPFSIYIFLFQKEFRKRFLVISSVSMFVICCVSAILALMSSSTINDLEGMLNLKGMLNYTILYLIIGIGGVGLMVANFFLVKYSGILLRKIVRKN